MKIEVEKEDIRFIGNTQFNVDGYTAFVCDKSTCGIERILLRNILKCFGVDMTIIASEDDWNDDCTKIESITYITNLPFGNLFGNGWVIFLNSINNCRNVFVV